MCCASNVKVKTAGRAREGGPAGRWREPKAGSRAPARPRCPRAPARGLQGCTPAAALSAGDGLVLPLLWPPRRTALRLPVAVPEVTDGAGPRPALTVHSHWPLNDLHAPLLVPWRPPAPCRPASACWRSRASSAMLGSGGRCPGAGCCGVPRVWGQGARGASSGDGTGSALPPRRRTRRAPGARSPLTPASPSQGTLIQHLKEFSLHGDMTSSDIILYYTTVRVPAASLLPGPGRPSAAPRHAGPPRSPRPCRPPRPAARWPLCAAPHSLLPPLLSER